MRHALVARIIGGKYAHMTDETWPVALDLPNAFFVTAKQVEGAE
jgi:hypothetical protein